MRMRQASPCQLPVCLGLFTSVLSYEVSQRVHIAALLGVSECVLVAFLLVFSSTSALSDALCSRPLPRACALPPLALSLPLPFPFLSIHFVSLLSPFSLLLLPSRGGLRSIAAAARLAPLTLVQMPLALQMLLQGAAPSPPRAVPVPSPLAHPPSPQGLPPALAPLCTAHSPLTVDAAAARRSASGIVAVVTEPGARDSARERQATGKALRTREERVSVTPRPVPASAGGAALSVSVVSKLVEVPYVWARGRVVAVQDTYLAYHVKDGSVRLIDVRTTGRGLIRLAPLPPAPPASPVELADLAFASPTIPRLAAADKTGAAAVYALNSEGDAKVNAQTLLKLRAPHAVAHAPSATARVAWQPRSAAHLALTDGRRSVRVVHVDRALTAYAHLRSTLPAVLLTALDRPTCTHKCCAGRSRGRGARR